MYELTFDASFTTRSKRMKYGIWRSKLHVSFSNHNQPILMFIFKKQQIPGKNPSKKFKHSLQI